MEERGSWLTKKAGGKSALATCRRVVFNATVHFIGWKGIREVSSMKYLTSAGCNSEGCKLCKIETDELL